MSIWELDFIYNYGSIAPQKLDNKTTTVKAMIYDPAQLIDIIFNSINDLVEYARYAEAELNQIQTINLALVILNRQTNLQRRHPGVETYKPSVQNMRQFQK